MDVNLASLVPEVTIQFVSGTLNTTNAIYTHTYIHTKKSKVAILLSTY